MWVCEVGVDVGVCEVGVDVGVCGGDRCGCVRWGRCGCV